MNKLVFFDLDGTILSGFSSENAFILYLLKKHKLGFTQWLKGFTFLLKWFPKFKKHVFIKNKAYLSGLTLDEVATIGQQFVSDALLKNIRPLLRERIEEHRKNGDQLVLLTGSPKFLADVFAKDLGIDDVKATECSVQDGAHFDSLPPTQHPFAEEKLTIAEAMCEQLGVDIKNCVAYGNSFNDRFILEAVGQPVAVTPHRKLRKLSEEKNWEILCVH